MKYFRDPKNQTYADLAFGLGRVVMQHEKIALVYFASDQMHDEYRELDFDRIVLVNSCLKKPNEYRNSVFIDYQKYKMIFSKMNLINLFRA